ncbi:MAG TPA: calcium/proton exchanger [Vicinamibacterales bacterium]|nr:calcium/proton exchanger [Vicinamibacterales bacterium]
MLDKRRSRLAAANSLWASPFAWALASVPVSTAVGYLTPERHVLVFATSVMAILPLAACIGVATEALADRLGGGIGGLLNATFGNAAELIIGILALREGLPNLVKASLTGSIIGNVLLVFGASAFIGGLRRPVQRFNRTAASLGTTMLLLSAIGLIVPAVFHYLVRGSRTPELTLDTEIAAVLLATYCISLVFTLRTHREHYGVSKVGAHPPASGASQRSRGTGQWVLLLLAATAGVAVVSELLVGSITETARTFGMTELFVGVVVVAFVGNAAEHYSAVVLAARDQMDAAMAIAVGSSTQIALFVGPLLVFLSYAIGPRPMDLLFTVFELVSIAIAVLSIAFIAHDGETHWMEGAQLLATYVILALGFYFLPS